MSITTSTADTEPHEIPDRRTFARDGTRLWRELLRRPLPLAALAYLTLLLVVAVGAPWLAPDDPEAQDLGHALSTPSTGHWLGTDRLGRDVLSRLMISVRPALLDTLEAAVVFVALGVSLGLLAGYLGRTFDRIISRAGDLLLALPGIMVLLMVLAVFPGKDLAAMITLGVLASPSPLRIVRGLTLSLRDELYVKAARLSGLTTVRVLWRHILPRLAAPVIVQVSLFSAGAILAQSGLSFLGMARPEAQGPTWGNMIGEASQVISQDGWLLIPTGGTLALTVLAFGLLGDAVGDVILDRSVAPGPHRPQRTPSRPPTTGRTADTGSLLSVRGLTIAFPGPGTDLTVVRDVGFDVAHGDALGIVGESGCGKSITVRGLLGLLPAGGRVTAGSALFEGEDLAGMPERQLARFRGSRIALIGQDPMNGLDPCFRIDSQLTEIIRRHRPTTRRQARARATELLEMVQLPEPEQVLRQYPHELSGGMAQRVSIALALAGDPALLIADEPTTALDVTVQAEILALLRQLRSRLGMAIILVTHDWGVLAGLCDRAVVMYAGETVEHATVEQLYRTPRHPYTQALLAANPHRAPLGEPLPSIPGSVPSPTAWPTGCHFQPRCAHATADCAVGRIPLTRPSPDRATRCIHADQVTP